MATNYDRNVVSTTVSSDLPSFRAPEVEIEGYRSEETWSNLSQEVVRDQFDCVDVSLIQNSIGVPINLGVYGEPRVQKKWDGTFIDIVVGFVPARGASEYEFRISKISG